MAAEFLTEGTTMSSVAKWYIALVVASGTVILLLAARWWSSASLTQFAALLCFTLFASTLKVRIPGMTSTISPNFAFTAAHLVVRPFDNNSAVALVLLAGTFYLSMNTALVSIVVGLTEQQPIKQVCQRCYEWAFPYFVFGIVVTGLISGSFSTTTAWRSSLQVAPAMVLAYLYFLGRSKKQAESRAVNEEAEELLAISSLER